MDLIDKEAAALQVQIDDLEAKHGPEAATGDGIRSERPCC
jgi:hypothetical protein